MTERRSSMDCKGWNAFSCQITFLCLVYIHLSCYFACPQWVLDSSVQREAAQWFFLLCAGGFSHIREGVEELKTPAGTALHLKSIVLMSFLPCRFIVFVHIVYKKKGLLPAVFLLHAWFTSIFFVSRPLHCGMFSRNQRRLVVFIINRGWKFAFQQTCVNIKSFIDNKSHTNPHVLQILTEKKNIIA